VRRRLPASTTGHAEHELHHHRLVEKTLVAQRQGQADVAGVEASRSCVGVPSG